MYRFCVVALEAKSLSGVAPAGGTIRRIFSASASCALAGLAIVDPMGAGVGALNASEMPRFIAEQQLRPLQEALLAYTAQSTASQASPRSSFVASVANRHPSAGMPPELLSGPVLVTGSLNQPTTSEFQITLNAARRDAGEARALADEMSRRVSEISNRFSAGDNHVDAQVASHQSSNVAPKHPESARPVVVAEARPRSQEKIEEKIPAKIQVPPADLSRASAANSNNTMKQPEDKPTAASVVPEQVAAAPPSRTAPATALPGLMSLGGANKNVTASIDPSALPEEAGANVSGVGIATRPVRNSASEGGAAVGTSNAAVTPSLDAAELAPTEPPPAPVRPPRSTRKTQTATEAYGYVPLSPPKDRSKKRATYQPQPAETATESTNSTTSNAQQRKGEQRMIVPVAKSAALSAGPGAPAGLAAKAVPKPAPPAVQQTAAAQTDAGGEAEQEKKGLFSWFKPILGKPIEMPRELSSRGWASD